MSRSQMWQCISQGTMTELSESISAPCDTRAIRSVLVVDDSRAQRMLLRHHLQRWGYSTVEASSGNAAISLCETCHFDLILSDWVMPGMNGLEFCRAFRDQPSDSYSYFILLTSKSHAGAVAEGLDVGADDFLGKPVAPDELRARINAGERLLQMQRQLRQRNAQITEALEQLRCLYSALDRDLIAARQLQNSLIREPQRRFGPASVSVILRSSGHVGGDMVGYFPIHDGQIGVFGFDVSGHGVASALMSARLAGMLSGNAPEQNIAMVQVGDGFEARPPEHVAQQLNQLLLSELETEHYFTLAYGVVDLCTGIVSMVQAGHPHPLVLRSSGKVEFLGNGGLPIGLLEGAAYCGFQTRLQAGDRLLIYSDGITEAMNEQADELGHDGITRIVRKLSGLHGQAFLQAMVWELVNWCGTEDFTDDISATLLEFHADDRVATTIAPSSGTPAGLHGEPPRSPGHPS